MDSREKALYCAQCACDKKADNIAILELKEVSSLADYFIVCSGTSDRHVQAIATNIEISMKQEGSLPLGIEGVREAKWVLLDYADIIIHVFQENERLFYDLEGLWTECPRIPFADAHGQ